MLELAGAASLSLTDAGDEPLLEPAPGETPVWHTVVVSALFASDLDLEPVCRVLRETCSVHGPIEQARVDAAEWRRAAERPTAARRIGTRLWLSAADGPEPSERLVHVRLNMGLAFGSGEHPTTALCLEWLEANLAPGATLIDYGCGSGVLAVAALALGASRAWAVDDDPQALLATAANAALNGVDSRLWVGAPDALPPNVEVDVIVANILVGPLERLARTFARHIKSGGRIVLSGVLESQVARILAAYQSQFECFASVGRGDWVRIEAERRKTR